MQLASDPAAKPTLPDRVLEAAPVVPFSVCTFSLNPEFTFARRSGAPARRERDGRFPGGSTEIEYMNELLEEFPQPVAACGDDRFNVRNSLAAACRSLG